MIKNVIEISKLKQIKENLETLNTPYKNELPNNEGAIFPIPYSLVRNAEEVEKYFAYSAHIQKDLTSIFSQEASSFVSNLLEKYTKKKAKLLYDENYKKFFSPLNTRMLKRKGKGLTIHCENSFLHQLEPGFLKIISSKADIENQLSFLLIIKKIKSHGNIILYNKEWTAFNVLPENFTDDIKKRDDYSFFKKGGLSDTKSMEIELEEGDLLIFRAGQIWHRVNQIDKAEDRITCGGFIAQSLNKEEILFWS